VLIDAFSSSHCKDPNEYANDTNPYFDIYQMGVPYMPPGRPLSSTKTDTQNEDIEMKHWTTFSERITSPDPYFLPNRNLPQ